MIPWAGFLGKLFEFCIERIASKKVDLALDSKKKAAWIFFQLHRSLATLEEACAVFIEVARPVVAGKKTRLYNGRLQEIAAKADEASEQFLSLMPRLQFVLECYDHDLAVMMGKVAFQKNQYLIVASLSDAFSLARFAVELSDAAALKSGGFSYTIPSDDLTTTDWKTLYSQVAATAASEGDMSAMTEWPTDCLMRLLKDRVSEQVVAPNDVNGIRTLLAFTEAQIGIITPVLRSLEAFIAKNFSVDDLLYVQDRGVR